MNFLKEDELMGSVLEGIVSVGGDRAYKTIYRLLQDSKNSHPLLAIEKSVSYAFDKAGHVLMNHIGKRLASERGSQLKPIQIPKGSFSLIVSNCLVHKFSDELRPTESVVCSLCRGYMEGVASKLGLGSLKDVKFSEGVCEFLYGGEIDGPDKLQY